jgi:hypothetical protein
MMFRCYCCRWGPDNKKKLKIHEVVPSELSQLDPTRFLFENFNPKVIFSKPLTIGSLLG